MCWSIGQSIDPDTSRTILCAYRRLKTILNGKAGVRDLVPSYTALALHFDPLQADVSDLSETIERVFHEKQGAAEHVDVQNENIRQIKFEVSYTGQDLENVATLHGLTVAEVIRLHKQPCYTVAMIGFIPHFPYLTGLDPRLETPRLAHPRKKVAAGSVAIGGAQAGIYPSDSPGGWNIIGHTDPGPLKDLVPGDRVMFYQ